MRSSTQVNDSIIDTAIFATNLNYKHALGKDTCPSKTKLDGLIRALYADVLFDVSSCEGAMAVVWDKECRCGQADLRLDVEAINGLCIFQLSLITPCDDKACPSDTHYHPVTSWKESL